MSFTSFYAKYNRAAEECKTTLSQLGTGKKTVRTWYPNNTVESEISSRDGDVYRIRKWYPGENGKNGMRKSVRLFLNGSLHHDYKPALVEWDKRGVMVLKAYYHHGRLSRSGEKPALYRWYPSGKRYMQLRYFLGNLHSFPYAAYVEWARDGRTVLNKSWFHYGILIRDDIPEEGEIYEEEEKRA